MPIYPYECDACGHTLEAFQMVSDRKLRKCPACAKPKLSRRIGGLGAAMVQPDFTHTTYQFHDDDCAAYGPRDNGQPRKLDPAGGLRMTDREAAEMQARMTHAGHTKHYDRGIFGSSRGKKMA